MSLRNENRFIVGRFSLNPDEESDLNYESEVANLWAASPPFLKQQNATHEGCDVVITLDWHPVAHAYEQQLQMARILRHAPQELPVDWWEIYSAEIRVQASVAMTGSNKLSKLDWYPEFFLENALYDLFVVLNLALPGSADFNNARVEQQCLHQRERLGLSAYSFDRYFAKRFPWPVLRKFEIDIVARWYGQVRRGIGQVPESPVERAIFALFHVCRSSGRPEDIVWLFYGYESLFQTRTGENFSALVDRIGLLLEPTAEEEQQLRKQLRAMYNHRSSFVHGGLQVIHPAQYDSIDPRIQSNYQTIVDLSAFGTRLLLACLQRYVANNWNNIGFKTSIVHLNS